jgi:hypothetical protein
MKLIAADRIQTMEYLSHLQLVDDIKALKHIAQTFVKGTAAKAVVSYEETDGGVSNCAVQVEFQDGNGIELELKKKFAGYDGDLAEALEDEWSDHIGSYLSGSDYKSEVEFDLTFEPVCRLTLYVEEK